MTSSRTLPKSCSDCPVHMRAEWNVLDRTGLALHSRNRQPLDFQAGEVIFDQGTKPKGIYCVESGHILLHQADMFGNDTAFRLIDGGDTTGWRSLFSSQTHAATAHALTASRLCLIEGKLIFDLLEKNPVLARRFLRTLAADRGPSDALLLRSPLLPVHMRLIHLLIVLRDQCATSVAPAEVVFKLPLKRMQIAAMIGTRSETLSRAIRQLEDEGLAKFEGRRVSVPDFAKMLEVAHRPAAE